MQISVDLACIKILLQKQWKSNKGTNASDVKAENDGSRLFFWNQSALTETYGNFSTFSIFTRRHLWMFPHSVSRSSNHLSRNCFHPLFLHLKLIIKFIISYLWSYLMLRLQLLHLLRLFLNLMLQLFWGFIFISQKLNFTNCLLCCLIIILDFAHKCESCSKQASCCHCTILLLDFIQLLSQPDAISKFQLFFSDNIALMWTFGIDEATSRANGVAWLITNRITHSIQCNGRAFIHVTTLFPFVSHDDNLWCEMDGMVFGINNNTFRLSRQRFFLELSRFRWCSLSINFGAFWALGKLGPEGTDFIAKLDHHLRLWWNIRVACLNTLILHRAFKERRKLPNWP